VGDHLTLVSPWDCVVIWLITSITPITVVIVTQKMEPNENEKWTGATEKCWSEDEGYMVL
jgi:hypothetical protein